MKTSESTAKIADAMRQAQGEFPAIPKTKTATVRSDKGNYSYDYADLADVIAAVQPALAKHGIAHLQSVQSEPGRVLVTTRFMHASGEWIETDPIALSVRDGGKPQEIGSAITYARRYALGAALGVAPEADDDANTAQGHDATTTRKPAASNADKVKAKVAAANGTKAPATPEERKADVKHRLEEAGVKEPAAMAARLGEIIGRPVDGKTVISEKDWQAVVDSLAKKEAA